MEDIIEEFGSGFLTITVTLFLVGYWYENMRQGGAVYEFVQQFLNCICGGYEVDMHEVIKVYGKTILQAIILVGVMWLVFRGVTDENGNKGIVEIVSGHMDQQMENPADFETFYEESQKAPPHFETAITGYLKIGTYQMTDIIKAWDYAENELQIQLMKVISPDGTVLENKLDFQMPGVYEVSVMTEDHDNRVRYAVVNIPVNE